jgi:hypothetical protein
MNLSGKFKDFLFVSFLPGFFATSWPTFSSMSCEVAQKSDKKLPTNQTLNLSG